MKKYNFGISELRPILLNNINKLKMMTIIFKFKECKPTILTVVHRQSSLTPSKTPTQTTSMTLRHSLQGNRSLK